MIVRLIVGLALLALGVGLGVLVAALGGVPFAIDRMLHDAAVAGRGAILTPIALALNVAGGGWFGSLVLPAALVIALLWVRRPWGAVYVVAACLVSVACVQILKSLVGRPRPEDMIVVSDVGSYPSGHVAHAATLAVALVVLFPVWQSVVAGVVWVLAMAWSRVYLGAHWPSDTVGGALVGAGAALVVAAVFTTALARERRVVRLRA